MEATVRDLFWLRTRGTITMLTSQGGDGLQNAVDTSFQAENTKKANDTIGMGAVSTGGGGGREERTT